MTNKDKPPADNKSVREAKLAQALRDNLRRRKASGRTGAKDSAGSGEGEPDPS